MILDIILLCLSSVAAFQDEPQTRPPVFPSSTQSYRTFRAFYGPVKHLETKGIREDIGLSEEDFKQLEPKVGKMVVSRELWRRLQMYQGKEDELDKQKRVDFYVNRDSKILSKFLSDQQFSRLCQINHQIDQISNVSSSGLVSKKVIADLEIRAVSVKKLKRLDVEFEDKIELLFKELDDQLQRLMFSRDRNIREKLASAASSKYENHFGDPHIFFAKSRVFSEESELVRRPFLERGTINCSKLAESIFALELADQDFVLDELDVSEAQRLKIRGLKATYFSSRDLPSALKETRLKPDKHTELATRINRELQEVLIGQQCERLFELAHQFQTMQYLDVNGLHNESFATKIGIAVLPEPVCNELQKLFSRQINNFETKAKSKMLELLMQRDAGIGSILSGSEMARFKEHFGKPCVYSLVAFYKTNGLVKRRYAAELRKKISNKNHSNK